MQEVIIIPARRSVVIRGGEGRASVIARRRSLDYTLSGGVFFFFSVCKRVEDSKREDEEHNRPFRINSTFDHLSPGKRAPRNTTPAPPPLPCDYADGARDETAGSRVRVFRLRFRRFLKCSGGG